MSGRRSLALLSEGMLNGGAKRAITIASIGWLVATGGPTPPVQFGQVDQSDTGGRYHKEWVDNRERIKKDDQEWMLFIKIFSEQCL